MTKQVEDMGMSLGVSGLDRWKGNLVWSFSRDLPLWRSRLALALSGYCGIQRRTDFNLGHSEENVNKCGPLKLRHTPMRKSGRSLAIFMLFSFPAHMSDSLLNQKGGFTVRALDVYAVSRRDLQWATQRKPFFFLANIGHFTITTLEFIFRQ